MKVLRNVLTSIGLFFAVLLLTAAGSMFVAILGGALVAVLTAGAALVGITVALAVLVVPPELFDEL